MFEHLTSKTLAFFPYLCYTSLIDNTARLPSLSGPHPIVPLSLTLSHTLTSLGDPPLLIIHHHFPILTAQRRPSMFPPFSSFPEPPSAFTDPRESDPRFKRFMAHHDRLDARRNALINLKYTLQSYGVNPKRINRAQRGIHDFLSCTDTIELPPSLSTYVPSSFYLPPPTDQEMEQRDI